MHHWYLREAKSLGVGFAAVKLTLFHQNFHSHFCSEAPTTTKTTVTDCTLTHIKYIATLSANLRNHDSPVERERQRYKDGLAFYVPIKETLSWWRGWLVGR